MKDRVVCDGDLICYRAAAANESRTIRATHKVTGQVTEHAHRTAFKEHIKGVFEYDEFEITDLQKAEDVSFALHSIKVTLQNICKACNVTDYVIYLSGSTNFRDTLPLPSKYKGNRKDTLRPLQLKECREYMIKHHKAIIVEGCEADDRLAEEAHKAKGQPYRTYIASLDKDAYYSDSYLFDWVKMDKPMRIKGLGNLELVVKKGSKTLKGVGRKWYYAQWAMGDSCDFYKPSELSGKSFGDVACYKLLNDCKTDKECIQAVYNQYKAWYPEPVTYTAWDGTEHTKDVIQIMDMYAACAWMRRWEDEVFDTRKVLEKVGVEL